MIAVDLELGHGFVLALWSSLAWCFLHIKGMNNFGGLLEFFGIVIFS